jgi:transposase
MPKKTPTRVRRSFTPEFKRDAVRLVREGKSLTEVAQNLGIARSLLQYWRKQIEQKEGGAFPGKGNASGEAAEITALRKRLRDAEEERDILKKALLGSTGQRNSFIEYICWRTKVQRFSRTLVQSRSDSVQVRLRASG